MHAVQYLLFVPLAVICPPRSNFQQAKICLASPFPTLQNSLKLQVWNCFYVWIGYRIYIEFLQQELFSLPRHLQHARASMKQIKYFPGNRIFMSFLYENFLFLRQSQATSLPWGNVHWELWLRSQSNLKKPPTSFTGSKPVSPISIPRGYCFKFHRGGDCAGCSLRHSCCKCEGAHRTLHCNFRGPRGNPRISSQVRGANKPTSTSTLPQANSTTLANSRKS